MDGVAHFYTALRLLFKFHVRLSHGRAGYECMPLQSDDRMMARYFVISRS